jgi:hemoglobin
VQTLARIVFADPLAGHPFEHDLHANHDERLSAYLSEAWGGPPLYTAGYGDESSVQRIHACNGVHIELDEACLSLFERAVSEMTAPTEAKAKLNSYFRRATEEMRRFESNDAEVPEGLPFNYA